MPQPEWSEDEKRGQEMDQLTVAVYTRHHLITETLFDPTRSQIESAVQRCVYGLPENSYVDVHLIGTSRRSGANEVPVSAISSGAFRIGNLNHA